MAVAPHTCSPPDPRASRAGRIQLLFLMSSLYAFAALDRTVLSLLVNQIGGELTISDAEFAMIIGLSFSVPQIMLALLRTRLVDRGSRKLIVTLSVTVWSGATVLSSLAGSAAQLLARRVAVGAGEASDSVYPSIISDLFGRGERGLANSVYSAKAAVVSIVGLAGGGWIAQHYGWRMTLVAAGLPALLLMLVTAFRFVDPRRGGSEAVPLADLQLPPVGETLGFIAAAANLPADGGGQCGAWPKLRHASVLVPRIPRARVWFESVAGRPRRWTGHGACRVRRLSERGLDGRSACGERSTLAARLPRAKSSRRQKNANQ